MDPLEIYQVLKDKIIWLELKPESTFNLAEMAASFGVSRNPLTIALTRLDAEGWVMRHGAHFMVSPLSLNRIREITEIRSIMEVQACVWALQRITKEELYSLGRVKDEILGLGQSPDNRDVVEMDVKFHHLIYQATKNDELAGLLERLLSHYLRFWLSIPKKIDLNSFFSEHNEIIRAIEANDEQRLKAASAEHIKKSVEEITGSF